MTSEDMDETMDKLLFPVNGIKVSDLFDWANETTALTRPKGRHSFMVNNVPIALFRYGSKVYAMDATCPHAGGPLYLGEIEDKPETGLCVRCPWHNWRFSLTTGRTVQPRETDKTVPTYPVKLDTNGKIYIGFDRIHEKNFISDEF